MTKFEAMLLVLKDRLLIGSGIVGLLLFLVAPYFYPLYLFAFLLVFNAFDLLGYRNVLDCQREEDKSNIKLPSYRLMQTTFEIFILAVIALSSNIYVALACKLAHWFGAQDVLYYIIGGFKMDALFTWLKWTPLGIVKGDLTSKEVEIQASIGVIISLIILFFI
jgi:hypothetical protein